MSSLATCTLLDKRMKRSLSSRSALIAALLAVAIFNPWTFGVTNGLTASIFGKPNILATGRGRPTGLGLLVHAAVVFLLGFFIYYLSMKPGDRAQVCCDPAALQVSSR